MWNLEIDHRLLQELFLQSTQALKCSRTVENWSSFVSLQRWVCLPGILTAEYTTD